MGRIKVLFLGAFFSLAVNNMQALVFEFSVLPGVDAMVATKLESNGLKLGIPFLGGTFKHTVTLGDLYSDLKSAADFSCKAVIGTCIESVVTKKDHWNKTVAVFVAQSLKQKALEEKLKEFYTLKAKIKKGSSSIHEKRQ